MRKVGNITDMTELSSEGGRAGRTGQDELKQVKLRMRSQEEPESAPETDSSKGFTAKVLSRCRSASSPFEVIAAGI
jgi:hypothetical protein